MSAIEATVYTDIDGTEFYGVEVEHANSWGSVTFERRYFRLDASGQAISYYRVSGYVPDSKRIRPLDGGYPNGHMYSGMPNTRHIEDPF